MQRVEGSPFTNGDANAGILPTILTPEFLNAVQEEVVNVILASGQELDKNNNRQFVQAFRTTALSTLQDGSIPSSKLADFAVTNEKLSDEAIAMAKLAAASIVSRTIKSAAITTEKLADSLVTTAKLANNRNLAGRVAAATIEVAKLESELGKRLQATGVDFNFSTDLQDTDVDSSDHTESFALPANYADNYSDILLVSGADNKSARSYTSMLIPIALFEQTSASGLRIPVVVASSTAQDVSVVVYKENDNLVYSRYDSTKTRDLTAQKVMLLNF